MSSNPASSVASILVVDDEKCIRTVLKETLERERYQVVASGNPCQALEILKERPFSVIISDHRMPEMTGLDFLVASRKVQPEASRILVTGVLSLPMIVAAINKGEIFRFLAKPWLREDLVDTVKTAVDRYEPIAAKAQVSLQVQELNRQLKSTNDSLAVQILALREQRDQLDRANQSLALRYEHSLDLCCRVVATFDPHLGRQAKAVVEIAGAMAADGHFTEQERYVLRTSSWLCDLGLIGVPAERLRAFREAPDQLSDRERTLFQAHPLYSQTLAAFVDNCPAVGETIRGHHERFDGSGYPDGLAADDIPWTARCLAVAVRFVENAVPKSVAIETILAESGRALDPEAVRLFQKAIQRLHPTPTMRELSLDELQPGMVVASGLNSPNGLLLVGEGQTLNPSLISKIRNHHRIKPFGQRLLVYA